MADTCDIGGSIRVVLRPRGEQVGAVEIASTRPLSAARVFVGKPVDDVVESIGRLFSLCGKAQTVAALRAAEQALGLDPAPGVEAARELLRLAEMLTQTAMRLGLHWPRALGLELRPDLVRAALAAEQAVEAQVAGMGWRAVGAGVTAPPDAMTDTLARLTDALAGSALVAQLATALEVRGREGFGALPEGMAPEAGALSRNWDARKVAAARAAHGAGLAARLAASAEDLARLPLEMIAALAGVEATPARAAPRRSGAGAATVETARGPLTHRIEIKDGVVVSCETEAPTEANFAPGGPAAAGLVGAVLDPGAAELHLLAIDPCVGCEVEVADA